MPIQVATIVLPTVAPLGTEVEAIADTLEHVSLSFPTGHLQEKVVYVYATNPAGLAAPLQVWIEIASVNVAAAYVLLGIPTVLVVTSDTVLQWTTHSAFVRVVAQSPLWVAGAWALQVLYEAGGAKS